MATVLNTTFKFKRGTAARWKELNLVLAEGEPGWAIDTYTLKIGDGVTPWNDLPEISNHIEETDIENAVNKYIEEHPINIVTDATLSVAG